MHHDDGPKALIWPSMANQPCQDKWEERFLLACLLCSCSFFYWIRFFLLPCRFFWASILICRVTCTRVVDNTTHGSPV
ncbi:hypothetical protein IF1G_07230 [Cordyceps javanica]|uniref:Uncharacterized protein n=1 Tax=Cordyceps javanica TaxID=43265 RepID=A0A545UY08_9HYPO|nr:hypothetical protein IF1G_07230 [Cordyceps javanica]